MSPSNAKVYQAETALKTLGFTPNKIKKILQSKKDITDISILNDINNGLEMLETAIIIEDLYDEIETEYKSTVDNARARYEAELKEADEIKKEAIKEAEEEVNEYKALIKDTRTNMTLIEGQIRQKMLKRTSC